MYLNILPRPGATVQQQIGTGTGYKTRGKFFWKEEDFYRYGGENKNKKEKCQRDLTTVEMKLTFRLLGTAHFNFIMCIYEEASA